MADVKWIKITTNMFDDEKIKLIEAMPDKDAILIIWVKLLVQAGKCNASGYLLLNQNFPYTDEMLSTVFNRPLNTVRMALETFKSFGMIDFNDNSFYISNWEKHQNVDGMEKIREQTRKRVAEHRANQKALSCNVTCNATITQSNATDIDIDKEYKTYSAFFESVWELYPEKKGKASISKTQKEKLEKVGYDTLVKCINRYKKDKPDWKQWQNGSTFFNKGYTDYLDENYSVSSGDSKFNPYKEVK